MLAPGKPLKNKTSTSTNEDIDMYYKDNSSSQNRDTNNSFLSTNSEDDDSEANFQKKNAEEKKIKNKETLNFLANHDRLASSPKSYPFFDGESTGAILEAIKCIQI